MIDYHKKFTYNYILDKIQSKIYIKDIISFDVETHNNNQSFTLGSIYDGVTHQTFYDRIDMRDKLLNTRYQNTLLVATNLQFDFCSLENMSEFHKYDIITRGGRFIMLKKRVRYENKKHENHDVTFSNTFIDSLNHYAGSVESAGKIIGTHKLDQPVYLGKEPRYDTKAKVIIDKETNEIKELDINEWEYLLQYNHGDTIVTYKLMKFLQDTYNQLGCEMKTTISSTALDLWRRKYLPCTMYKEEFVLGYDIKHEIFKCYYGGRTEIFARGLIESTKDKKWKLLDINSLYPAMMCNEYPLPQSIQKPSTMTIKNIIDYEGFSDVEVECEEMYYPLLPFRDHKRGKLIFPVGRWRGSYTNLELRRALELGYKINKIYLQYIYTQKFKPFESYVLDLYNKRLEYQKEKSPMEVVTKLLLNSMYGKLGQKDFVEYQWFDISLMTGDDYNSYLDSIDSTTFGNLGFKRVIKECNANFIFPILPAYVTAYGRLKIHEELVKYKGIYCDSVSKDSNIILENLNSISVEDYYNIHSEGYEYIRDKEFKHFCSIKILCNNGKRNVFIKPSKIIRHKIKDIIYRIYLTNSEYIDVTKYHSLIIKENDNLVSITPDKLSTKSKLLFNSYIPRKIHSFSVDIKFFELLGFIIGNGYLSKQQKSKTYNYIKLSTGYKTQIMERLVIPLQNEYRFNITHRINSTELAMKCYEYGIYDSNNIKCIPNKIFNESKTNIRAFIRGYFSADGSISIRNNYPIIKLDSINKDNLIKVQKLLQIVNISSSYFESKTNTSYKGKISKYNMKRVCISDRNKFLDEIGFITDVRNRIDKINMDSRDFGYDFKERRVLRIEKIEYDDYVYDFEIPEYQNFYANNILVHNTDSVITCDENVVTSNKLGELKVEDNIKKAILIRPKLYMKINELERVKVKIKGIPKATVASFEKILQHDRVYYSKFTKPNESIRHGYKINEVRQDSKSVSVEDNKRLWSKPFDYTELDYESRPIMINEPTLYTLKGLRKRTVREKMLQAEHERNKVHIQLQQEFIDSDLFDSSSVGSDISSEEFLKNEEWFDKRGL
jgi:intein/homing endonuclease